MDQPTDHTGDSCSQCDHQSYDQHQGDNCGQQNCDQNNCPQNCNQQDNCNQQTDCHDGGPWSTGLVGGNLVGGLLG